MRIDLSRNTMHIGLRSLGTLCLAIRAQSEANPCPGTDLACHDIMDSSQCIAQLVLQSNQPPTNEAMIKCVEHEGAASSLPGAAKASSVTLGILRT